MGRAEERFLEAAAEREANLFAASERYRLQCRDELYPRLVELSKEFLEKMEAADWPITPDYGGETASWKIGGPKEDFRIYSDGRLLSVGSSGYTHDPAGTFEVDAERVAITGYVPFQYSAMRLRQRVERLEALVARIPAP